MKTGRRGSRLIPIALCALIAMLLVKLAITIGSSLPAREPTVATQETTAPGGSPEAAVVNTGPGIVSETYAAQVPSDKNAKAAQKSQMDNSTVDAICALQQKEEDIRKREEQLKEREERLARIEKEVEQKVKDLLAIQKDIQAARAEKQENTGAKVRSLAKIYGTMKPKEAAKLLDNLDDKLVMGIISTMTPDEAAAILSLMEVKKAAKISEALSGAK